MHVTALTIIICWLYFSVVPVITAFSRLDVAFRYYYMLHVVIYHLLVFVVLTL